MNLLKWNIFKKFTPTHGRLIKSYSCVKFSSVDKLRLISSEISFISFLMSINSYVLAIMRNHNQEYQIIYIIAFFITFATILSYISYYIEYMNVTRLSQNEIIINMGLICLYSIIIMFIKMTIAISMIGLIFIYWIGLDNYFIISIITPPVCGLCIIFAYILSTLIYIISVNMIKVFNMIR